MNLLIPTIAISLLLIGCTENSQDPAVQESATAQAVEFIADTNRELSGLEAKTAAAAFVWATDMNDERGMILAQASARQSDWLVQRVADSLTFGGQDLPADTRRALELLKLDVEQPLPADPNAQRELSAILADLERRLAEVQYCPAGQGKPCMDGGDLQYALAATRDHDDALQYWRAWHQASAPMRPAYTRMVELSNAGARALGYSDQGSLWRSRYDMDPQSFEQETNRLWQQLEPLYEALHCHVRAKLSAQYDASKVPLDAPIPAHLLGNIWGQNWESLYELVAPYPEAASPDPGERLRSNNMAPVDMVKMSEQFYLSLGFAPLPDSFWERSIFSQAADRAMQCHPTAWGLANGADPRLTMCIDQTYQDLKIIHHELGHLFYNRASGVQPALFHAGANPGFHEAIGDTVVLAMTPAYLKSKGLLAEATQSQEVVLNEQMQRALDRIALLPWAILVDQWRWDVFSGDITSDDYNQRWWQLRERYQGISPPGERGEDYFDPGAKIHVAVNESYTRYFTAVVLQFQFYRELCQEAGHTGPLHQCSFYGSESAGQKLDSMLAQGRSQPWQDTLEAFSGSREMDASAITEYFEPLSAWLSQQNEGRSCGW